MKKLTILSVLFLMASTALAKPERDIRVTTGASVNLIGLQSTADLTWSWKLYKTDNPLLADAHLTIGISDALSPSINRLGGWIEFSPLSILDLRFGVEPSVYFGTFGSVIGFADYDGLFSEDERDLRAGERQSAVAARAYFAPTLKLKVGHIIAAASAELELWTMQNPENLSGGTFFYEPGRDTLIDGNGDFVVQTSSVLLYEFLFSRNRQLLAGFIHNLLSVPNLGGDADNDNQRQTIGLLGVYSMGNSWGKRLHRPSIISQVSFYLQDRADLEKVNELGFTVALRFFLNPKAE